MLRRLPAFALRRLPALAIQIFPALLLLPAIAFAQEPLPIFDAHIHYAHDAFEAVPAPQLIGLMRKAGLRRALVSGAMAPGSIDDGAQKLYALAPDLIIPSLRPYRKREDVPTWYRDPEVLAELEARLKKYRYAAIGEFHLYGANADTAVIRKVVQLARQYDILLHAHSDRDAIERLIKHDPNVRVLWAHAGFESPAVVSEMLGKYKNLWSDLAYRTDMGGDGTVNPDWLEVFKRYPDRFMLGTDTFTLERLHYIGEHANYSRGWLKGLSADLAERIAYQNGEALLAQIWKQGGPKRRP